MLLDLDYDFFSKSVFNNDNKRTYQEEITGSDTLLLTIGDSWTWGDSIDDIGSLILPDDGSHTFKNDSPLRLKSIYGYHLKNLIGNCDWINIGKPGTENRWLIECVEHFIMNVHKVNYKKIIISLGLTDIGRDVLQTNPGPNLRDKFVSIESDLLTRVQQLNSSNINILVSRNFTDTFPENKQIPTYHLPSRWVDISKKMWDSSVELNACYTVKTPEAVTEQDKIWFLDQVVPGAESMIDFLNLCPLHYKRSSKHPTEKSHEYWANYVYQYILENQLI